MTKQKVLDLTEARKRRDAGMQKAAGNNVAFLEKAREIAVMQIQILGWFITIDVLRYAYLDHWPQPTTPNAWGCVFKDRRFRPAVDSKGREIRVQSRRPEAHGRWIRAWTLA